MKLDKNKYFFLLNRTRTSMFFFVRISRPVHLFYKKKYHQKINESSEHWSTKTCHLATPNLPGLLRHFLGWLT